LTGCLLTGGTVLTERSFIYFSTAPEQTTSNTSPPKNSNLMVRS
jgi:hypothetical protein